MIDNSDVFRGAIRVLEHPHRLINNGSFSESYKQR